MNKKQAKRSRAAACKEAKRQDLWKKLEGYVFEKRWRRFLAWLFPKKRAEFEKWIANAYRLQLKAWSKQAYEQSKDKGLLAFHKLQLKRRRKEAWVKYNAEEAAWKAEREAETARFQERQQTIEKVYEELKEEETNANVVR